VDVKPERAEPADEIVGDRRARRPDTIGIKAPRRAVRKSRSLLQVPNRELDDRMAPVVSVEEDGVSHTVGPQGKSAPSYSPKIIDATAADGATTTADFKLLAGIELQLHFAKSSVPANGTEVVNGTITTTEFGKPLPNVTVQLEVMPGKTAAEAVTSAPRATVCNSGNRLWPTGTMASPDGFPVTVTTDSTGHYDLAITVGTTPGTWRLDALGRELRRDIVDRHQRAPKPRPSRSPGSVRNRWPTSSASSTPQPSRPEP